jgi:hypothetical protein
MGSPTHANGVLVAGRAEAIVRFMPPVASVSTICRTRLQRYKKVLKIASFFAEILLAKLRLFLRVDTHIVTSLTEPDFGHVKKFCIFLPKNLQISNHVTIRVLQGSRMAKIGANCRKWLIY